MLSLEEQDVAALLHPYTNHTAHAQNGPHIITGGEGIHVTDSHGNRYIEAMAGLWCVSLGYGEERLIQAASEQMRTLTYSHLFNSKSVESAITLAERLVAMAPLAQGAKVFFGASGSDANDTAIKILRYYNNALGRPQKKKIIARTRGYHGVTVAASALTGLQLLHTDFDADLSTVRHLSCPHYYREGGEGESEAAFTQRLVAELEALIEKEGADTIAAFIAEPVMGAGGVIVPPEGYFQAIQPVLKRHDILMWADEVICGFGRLGTAWGSEFFDIQPDIVTAAKAITSAYVPLSATMISQGIADVVCEHSGKLGAFGHGYTYSGHPVSCAVALEALKIYEERGLFAHAAEMAPLLQEGLRGFADHPLVGEVRGVGLIAAVELVADKATKAGFPKERAVGPTGARLAQEHGLIVRPLPGLDALAFCPPLVAQAGDVEEIVVRFGKTLDDLQGHLGL